MRYVGVFSEEDIRLPVHLLWRRN